MQFLLFWWRCRSCGFFWPRFLTASSIFARGPRMSHHPSHVVEDSEKWTGGLWAVQKAVVIFLKVIHNVDKFMLKLHFKFLYSSFGCPALRNYHTKLSSVSQCSWFKIFCHKSILDKSQFIVPMSMKFMKIKALLLYQFLKLTNQKRLYFSRFFTWWYVKLRFLEKNLIQQP